MQRFNSPPADVVTWPWGFGCRMVSVSQLKRWHRLCDSAWGPSAFARRFTGCSGTAEARLTRDRFTHASLKWIQCGWERTLKSRLKCWLQILKTEAFIWACLFWSIVQTQGNNILAPLKVSLCQCYISILPSGQERPPLGVSAFLTLLHLPRNVIELMTRNSN